MWTDVSRILISRFLNNFQTYQTDSLGAKILMPIKHIQEYVSTINTEWDVALYSGSSSEKNYDFSHTPIKAEHILLKVNFSELMQIISILK